MSEFTLLRAIVTVAAAGAAFAVPVTVVPALGQAQNPQSPSAVSRETPKADGQRVDGAGGAQHIEWGYTGPTGPAHWAELSKNYTICSAGQQESPINLIQAIPADLGKLAINWQSFALKATNNGHTVQFDAPPGSNFTLAGQTYQLVQFHIHHPSEHLLDGRRFPLEIHFVHRLPGGTLGVIGVLVAAGGANPALQKVLDTIPRDRDATMDGPMIDPAGLLPRQRSFDRYEGSLTTPPCSESVDWVVLSQPVQASTAQIDQFAGIFPFNARPVQDLNRRFLLSSR